MRPLFEDLEAVRKKKSCYRCVVEGLEKKIGLLQLVSISYAAGVLLDYMFVYSFNISTRVKCAQWNGYLQSITVFYSRVLLEFLNMMIFCVMFKWKRYRPRTICMSTKNFTYVLRILMGFSITRKEFKNFLIAQQILFVCLVLLVLLIPVPIPAYVLLVMHFPRLFAVIKMLLRRPKGTPSRFLTKLARFFFFVYVYSIQLFAALWYLSALYVETRCWKEAYEKHTGHSYDAYKCIISISSEEDKFVSDYCSTNTTKYDFGMYTNVHQSGVLLKENFLIQNLYFSRWALQCLSSFAQGLEAGASVWQNFFVIIIMVYGLFVFFFLLGEVQSERERYAQLVSKLQKTKEWIKGRMVSENLQSKIKKHQQDKWPETKDVNIENVFHILPEKQRGKLTHELCLEQLKKVNAFGNWSEQLLQELCNYVKPIFFVDRTYIIQEGDPICEMIFVVKGMLWTFTKASPLNFDRLKDGDSYGEELVNLLHPDSDASSELPISPKTIQAVTNVEAFVLMAHDLKAFMIKRQETQTAFLFSQLPGDGLFDF